MESDRNDFSKKPDGKKISDNSLINNSLFQDSIKGQDSFMTDRSDYNRDQVGKSNNVTSLSLSKSNLNLETNRDK